MNKRIQNNKKIPVDPTVSLRETAIKPSPDVHDNAREEPTDPHDSAQPEPQGQARCDFPIVGIGASAGGLHALEELFRFTPCESGMAYVVVQHLDPMHKGMLCELLQQKTKMKVVQARQGMTVVRDHVYVIPPNKDMAIREGKLRLFAPAEPRGLRLPIDFFLRSLANDCRERSAAIILSGMGSDGVLGLQAIKEASGVVLVEEPASAKCDSMPRCAIDTGKVDIIAPPEELPAKLLHLLKTNPRCHAPPNPQNTEYNALFEVTRFLRSHIGHDFSLYKKSTISRRVERRMGIHQIDSIEGYLEYLRKNPQEAELLFKELLIGVTRFFRDTPAWEHLRDHSLPTLLKDNPTIRELRAWTPGCSTGEEAYSLAIAFLEAQESLHPPRHCRLQIFATDLDSDAIDKARQGYFPANIAADVSPERLARFFIQEDDGYRITTKVRESVVFAPQNVLMDPPFTKIDILLCRNLLIYMEAQLQKTILPLFHYSLKPGGILFLGSAETIGGFTNLFAAEEGTHRIYRRLGGKSLPDMTTLPVSSGVGGGHLGEGTSVRLLPSVNIQTLADRVILRHHAPPAVLATAAGDVVYISSETGRYLEPAVGKANLNLFAMARKGIREELWSAFHRAVKEHGTIEAKGGRLHTGSSEQQVDLIVQLLDDPVELWGMVLVIFRDVPGESISSAGAPSSPCVKADGSVQDLDRVHQELRSVRLQNQTAQEDLRSSNEELQSTNEELQSTNEELITSKEEMQSMNEELQTVNAELQAKVNELSVAASDVRNLLDSTDIAMIFLDADLRLRRYTSRATQIIKFIPGDLGRPITDLASDLDYPSLIEDAREVLNTLVASEKEVAAKENRWFSARIMPYRTIDDKIDGVVITLTDISEHRKESKCQSPE